MSNKARKSNIVSIRLESNLFECFDQLSKATQFNKSEFLRECIEKLCKDNIFYLAHYQKIKQYIDDIQKEMIKLPENLVKIENGTWNTMKDISWFMLCDFLFHYSEKVFNAWLEICAENNIIFYNEDGEPIIEYLEEDLFDLEDILFLITPQKQAINIKELISDSQWTDEVENKKISLLLAVRKAIQEHTALNIINEAITRIAEEEGTMVRIKIDAEGKFSKSGTTLITPVEYEKIENQQARK